MVAFYIIVQGFVMLLHSVTRTADDVTPSERIFKFRKNLARVESKESCLRL